MIPIGVVGHTERPTLTQNLTHLTLKDRCVDFQNTMPSYLGLGGVIHDTLNQLVLIPENSSTVSYHLIEVE